SEADREEYWDKIPVTFVDGRRHDFWRVDAQRLRDALSSSRVGDRRTPTLFSDRVRRGGNKAFSWIKDWGHTPPTMCMLSQARNLGAKTPRGCDGVDLRRTPCTAHTQPEPTPPRSTRCDQPPASAPGEGNPGGHRRPTPGLPSCPSGP